MLEQLRFYFKHSLNDLRVSGQRAIFALLAIAAGVAAVVSLQTLGVMIQDSLTSSLQESNRGDIRVIVWPDPSLPDAVIDRGVTDGITEIVGSFNVRVFGRSGIDQMQQWADENFPGEITQTFDQALTETTGAGLSIPARGTSNPITVPFIVDADRYPLYGEIRSEDGRLLAEMLQSPRYIVISRNVADKLQAQVGDIAHLNGVSGEFMVRGIVPTETEGGLENIASNLLGFYYADMSILQFFGGMNETTDILYWRLRDPSRMEEISAAVNHDFPYLTTRTTEGLRRENLEISSNLTQLVSIMGLVSMLIGGIGIINTMNVIVSRRLLEVAVLKTVGLEAEHISLLFLTEAFLMGVIGSVLGIAFGWLLTLAIKGAAQSFLSEALVFHITAAPPITGFVVGVLVATIFGLLPTLNAGQIRPNLILQPTQSVIPTVGRARSFAALLVMLLALSLVAQPLVGGLFTPATAEKDSVTAALSVPDDSAVVPTTIVGLAPITFAAGASSAALSLLIGVTMLSGDLLSAYLNIRAVRGLLGIVLLPLAGFIFGVFIPAVLLLISTFIFVALLYALLWMVISLVGNYAPTLGSVDLKIALRSMLNARGRAASTLLALVVGIFTLSVITMLVTSILDRFEQALIDQAGGNVLIFAVGTGTMPRIEESLAAFQDVATYAVVGAYQTELVSVEDVSDHVTLTPGDLRQRIIEAGKEPVVSFLALSFGSMNARDVDSNLPNVDFYAGRQLTPDDADQPVMVMTANGATVPAGFEIGDLVTLRFVDNNPLTGERSTTADETITLEVVGMIEGRGVAFNAGAPNYAPSGVFPTGRVPNQVNAIVEIDEQYLPALRLSLDQIPGTFMVETRLLNDLVNRVIRQFTAFPTLVSALALLAGGIVIANSVALSTLERRREIAIMKAVGLQRERVLGMLLLENGIMGLIGGLIGVGIGAALLYLLLLTVFEGRLGDSIPIVTALLLMVLCIFIALTAALISVWRASGEKPLDVLRYE